MMVVVYHDGVSQKWSEYVDHDEGLMFIDRLISLGYKMCDILVIVGEITDISEVIPIE